MRKRGLIDVRFVLLLCALAGVAGLAACGDDGGGGTGSASASGTGGGSTSTGATTSSGGSSSTGDTYQPDPVPCEAPSGCQEDENCCPEPQPYMAGLGAPMCPGAYPFNWSCNQETGQCEHGGCSQDEDCVVYGLTCEDVGGIGRCVQLCQNDNDCLIAGDPGTKCIGSTDDLGNYCVEDVS